MAATADQIIVSEHSAVQFSFATMSFAYVALLREFEEATVPLCRAVGTVCCHACMRMIAHTLDTQTVSS